MRIAPAWFVTLALAVAGPLMGSGYLLLLDFPSGPHFLDPVVFRLPSSGGLGNVTPLLAIGSAVRAIHSLLPDKLFLLLPILLGGAGVYRFLRRPLGVGVWAALYGGTLFVINPFVLDRYLAGQLHFLLAYGLLPWGLSAVFDLASAPSVGAAVRSGLWIFLLAAVSVHMAGAYAVLVILAAAASLRPVRWRIASAATSLGIGALLSAYWLLPSLLAPPGLRIGQPDLAAYASRPRGYGVIPALAGMYGFWRDEFEGPIQRIPGLAVLIVAIIGLAVLGLVTLRRSRERRRFATAISIGAALALVIAAGTSFPPTEGIFRWLFDHLPVLRIYREPQKFLVLLVVAYAVLGGAGLQVTLHALRREGARVRTTMAVAFLAAILAYGYSMFWGFSGDVRLSRYPDDWARAERVMDAGGSGRLLMLPWHLYAVWSFSDGRIVANPARSFFSREVVVNDEAGFESVPVQSSDPFSRYVREILEHRDSIRWFGHLVAPLGVRYVALLSEVDHREYGFLESQGDLRPLYRGRDLVVFENLAWRGSTLDLEPGGRLPGLSHILGTDDERRVVEELALDEPRVSPADPNLPPVVRGLPIWRTVARRDEGTFTLAAERCTDGWRLGNERARCHLGAVAAFPAPAAFETLWRPGAGATLLGLGVSGLTLLGVAIYGLNAVRPRTHERRERRVPPRRGADTAPIGERR